jgi:CMP-N,N'-diacetyllegionaminic acid synthase
MNPKVLAIIPARAGSKRIPQKNKRLFLGKPLIQWTIEEALKSLKITKICVTTDDVDILSYSNLFPTVHFIKRSEELSQDGTSGIDPILDVMAKTTETFDYVLLLQPTSPLRTACNIDSAIDQLYSKCADFLISVRPFAEKINHVVCQDLRSDVSLLSKHVQDQELFTLNGAIYIASWGKFISTKNFIQSNTELYLMSAEESVDIDVEDDWQSAERLMSLKITARHQS